MTANIQLSGKANDGRIFVVGGDSYEEFRANVLALVDDPGTADALIADAAKLIAGVGVGVSQPAADPFTGAQNVVQAAFPQAAPQPQQSSGPQPGETPPTGKNGKPMRLVPAGVSKKTGKPYAAFWAEDRY